MAQAQAQAKARACRVPLHRKPQLVNMGMPTNRLDVQYPPNAQIQVRSGRSRRLSAGVHNNQRFGESTPLVAGLAMAAPTSLPNKCSAKRSFLPRVAGLPRRVQPNVATLKEFKTPLARPVPKKNMPRPKAQQLAVLNNSNVSGTSGSGNNGELIAQVGMPEADSEAEVPTWDNVQELLTFPRLHNSSCDLHPRTLTASCDSLHSDKKTNDDSTNSIMEDNSDIEELEAHTWDEETVKTFNESCQQLNETVTNLKSINEQIEASAASKEQKRKQSLFNEHMIQELKMLTKMNIQMHGNLQAIIGSVLRTEGGGPSDVPPKPQNPAETPTNNNSTTPGTNDLSPSESFCSFYSPSPCFRSIQFCHEEVMASEVHIPRLTAESVVCGIVNEYIMIRTSDSESDTDDENEVENKSDAESIDIFYDFSQYPPLMTHEDEKKSDAESIDIFYDFSQYPPLMTHEVEKKSDAESIDIFYDFSQYPPLMTHEVEKKSDAESIDIFYDFSQYPPLMTHEDEKKSDAESIDIFYDFSQYPPLMTYEVEKKSDAESIHVFIDISQFPDLKFLEGSLVESWMLIQLLTLALTVHPGTRKSRGPGLKVNKRKTTRLNGKRTKSSKKFRDGSQVEAWMLIELLTLALTVDRSTRKAREPGLKVNKRKTTRLNGKRTKSSKKVNTSLRLARVEADSAKDCCQ
ncbi:uncharacterized protein LOC117896721 [Drosophila subobscura]|uniref:uncharacterized protein LOC117896721 n=1 Tax=Drosophila subobscura TaxID=7241 RepID=UPI00155B0872|nr:uncharacterized protein LOC117896721 [Drosophila subobscura]